MLALLLYKNNNSKNNNKAFPKGFIKKKLNTRLS